MFILMFMYMKNDINMQYFNYIFVQLKIFFYKYNKNFMETLTLFYIAYYKLAFKILHKHLYLNLI